MAIRSEFIRCGCGAAFGSAFRRLCVCFLSGLLFLLRFPSFLVLCFFICVVLRKERGMIVLSTPPPGSMIREREVPFIDELTSPSCSGWHANWSVDVWSTILPLYYVSTALEISSCVVPTGVNAHLLAEFHPILQSSVLKLHACKCNASRFMPSIMTWGRRERERKERIFFLWFQFFWVHASFDWWENHACQMTSLFGHGVTLGSGIIFVVDRWLLFRTDCFSDQSGNSFKSWPVGIHCYGGIFPLDLRGRKIALFL